MMYEKPTKLMGESSNPSLMCAVVAGLLKVDSDAHAACFLTTRPILRDPANDCVWIVSRHTYKRLPDGSNAIGNIRIPFPRIVLVLALFVAVRPCVGWIDVFKELELVTALLPNWTQPIGPQTPGLLQVGLEMLASGWLLEAVWNNSKWPYLNGVTSLPYIKSTGSFSSKRLFLPW